MGSRRSGATARDAARDGTTALTALAGACMLLASPADARWVDAWESAIATLDGPVASGHTIRQFARLSLGGGHLRVRFSNETGTRPLRAVDGHVAVAATAPGTVDASTDRALTFHGSPQGIVAPGAFALSDPVELPLPSLARVAVSAQYFTQSAVQVGHLVSGEINHVAAGDHSGEAYMEGARPVRSGYYVSGIVVDAQAAGATVAIGDSITDGLNSTYDADRRWPDVLAARLAVNASGAVAVADGGLTSNAVLTGAATPAGPSRSARLGRDAVSRTGVRWIILLEGIDDIHGDGEPSQIASDLVAAYQEMVEEAHGSGVKVFGGTLLPYGAAGSGLWTPARDRARMAVNAWIRTSGAFDAVIDFDAAMRDPRDATKLRRDLGSADGIHPNDAGYAVRGNSVPASLFR